MIFYCLCDVIFACPDRSSQAASELRDIEGLRTRLKRLPTGGLNDLAPDEQMGVMRKWEDEFYAFLEDLECIDFDKLQRIKEVEDVLHFGRFVTGNGRIRSVRDLASAIESLGSGLKKFSDCAHWNRWLEKTNNALGEEKLVKWLHEILPRKPIFATYVQSPMTQDFRAAEKRLLQEKFRREISEIAQTLSEHKCSMPLWNRVLGDMPLDKWLEKASRYSSWLEGANTLVRALNTDIENLLVGLRA